MIYNSFASLFRDRTILLLSLCLLLGSAAAASTLPYQSLVALNQLGFTSGEYSVILVVIASVSVLLATSVGAITDYLKNRSFVMLGAAAAGCAGHLIISLWFNPISFVVVHVLLFPISMTLFQQFFAAIRLHTAQMSNDDAGAVTSSARIIIAISYVIVPPISGLLLWLGASLRELYYIGAVLYAICLAVMALIFSRNGKSISGENKTHSTLNKSSPLRRIRFSSVAPGVAMICLLETARRLNSIIFPLIVVKSAGGTATDVGTIAGITALCEIPAMLFWSHMSRRFPRAKLLGVAAIIYCTYLILLSQTHSVFLVYLLVPLNVAGVAALMSVNIAFLQDLLPDRPGLGSSLISVSGFGGWVAASVCLLLTDSNDGYQWLSALGACFALAGGVSLLVSSRRNRATTNNVQPN